MSAALVGQLDVSQCLQDDLESSLYVLLWMGIMYSPCNDTKSLAAFLDHCLDPLVQPNTCFTGKADFILGRTLLSNIQFIGCPGLLQLLEELTKLFGACYKLLKAKPPQTEEQWQARQEELEDYRRIVQDAEREPDNGFYQRALW